MTVEAPAASLIMTMTPPLSPSNSPSQQQRQRQAPDLFGTASLVVHRHQFSISKSPNSPKQSKRAGNSNSGRTSSSSSDGVVGVENSEEQKEELGRHHHHDHHHRSSGTSKSPRRKKKSVPLPPPPPPPPDDDEQQPQDGRLSASTEGDNSKEQDEQQRLERRRRRRRESHSEDQHPPQEQDPTSSETPTTPTTRRRRSRTSDAVASSAAVADGSSSRSALSPPPPTQSPVMTKTPSLREERSIVRRDRRKSDVAVAMVAAIPPAPIISTSIHSPKVHPQRQGTSTGGGDHTSPSIISSPSPRRARRKQRAFSTTTSTVTTEGVSALPVVRGEQRPSTSRSLSPGTVRRQRVSTTTMNNGGASTVVEALLSPRALRRKQRLRAELAIPNNTTVTRSASVSSAPTSSVDSSNVVTPRQERRRFRASTTDIVTSPTTTTAATRSSDGNGVGGGGGGGGSLSPIRERRRQHRASANDISITNQSPHRRSNAPHETMESKMSPRRRRRLVTPSPPVPSASTATPAAAAATTTGTTRSRSKGRSQSPSRSQSTPSSSTTPQSRRQTVPLALPLLDLPVTSPTIGGSRKDPMISPPTSARSTRREDRKQLQSRSSPATTGSSTATQGVPAPPMVSPPQTPQPQHPHSSKVTRHSMPNMETPLELGSPTTSSPHHHHHRRHHHHTSRSPTKGRSRSTSRAESSRRSLPAESSHPHRRTSAAAVTGRNPSLQRFLITDAAAEKTRHNNPGEDRSISLQSEPALSPRKKHHHSSSSSSRRRSSSRSRGGQRHDSHQSSKNAVSNNNDKKRSSSSTPVPSASTAANPLERLLEKHGSWDQHLAGKDDRSCSMQSAPLPPPHTTTTLSPSPTEKRSNSVTKMEPKSPSRLSATKNPSSHGAASKSATTTLSSCAASNSTTTGLTLKEELEQLLNIDLKFGAAAAGGNPPRPIEEKETNPASPQRKKNRSTKSLTHFMSEELTSWNANHHNNNPVGWYAEDQSISLRSEPPLTDVKKRSIATTAMKQRWPVNNGTASSTTKTTGNASHNHKNNSKNGGSDSNLDWNRTWHAGPSEWGDFASSTKNVSLAKNNTISTKDATTATKPPMDVSNTFDIFLQADRDWETNVAWHRQGPLLGASWQSAPTTSFSKNVVSDKGDTNRQGDASHKSLGGHLSQDEKDNKKDVAPWTETDSGFAWQEEKKSKEGDGLVMEPDEDMEPPQHPSPKTTTSPMIASKQSAPLDPSRKPPTHTPSKQAVMDSLEDSIVWSHSFSVPEEIVSPMSIASKQSGLAESSRWHNSCNFADDETPTHDSFQLPPPSSVLRRGPDEVNNSGQGADTRSPRLNSGQSSKEGAVGKSLGNFFDVSRWQTGGSASLEDRSIAQTSLKSEPPPNPKRRSFTLIDSGLSVVTEPPPASRQSAGAIVESQRPPRSPTKKSAKSLGAFLDSRWQSTSEKGDDEKSLGHRSLKSEPPMSPPLRKESNHKSTTISPSVTSNYEVRSPKPPGPRDRDGSKPPRMPGTKKTGKLGSFLEESRWNHGGRTTGEEEASVGHRSLKSEPPMSPMRAPSFGNGLLSTDQLKLPLSSGGEKKSKVPRSPNKGQKSLKAFFDDSRWKSNTTKLVDDEKSQGHISLQSEPPYTPTRRSSFVKNSMSQSVAAYLPSSFPVAAGSESRANAPSKLGGNTKKRGKSLEAFVDDSRWKSSSNLGLEEEQPSGGNILPKSEPPMNPLRKNSIVKIQSASVVEATTASTNGATEDATNPSSKAGNADLIETATTWDDDVNLLLRKCEEQMDSVFLKNTHALET